MIEMLHFEFMRNAIIAGFLVSIACGIIGSLIVVNRMVFISGGVAHAAYGGIGIAFFLGLSPLLGATVFSVVIAVIMGVFTLKNRQRSDTVIGVIWAVGMAIGILFIDFTPGYAVDLMSYLFGSILTVPRTDLFYMLVVDGVIVALVSLFYRDFLALSYDEEFAGLRGIPVRLLYFALLILSALTIVMAIQVVGLILVIALITIPTSIAERLAGTLKGMMVYSFIFGAVFTLLGLWLSFALNLTSGASIIMVAAVFFLLSHLLPKFGKSER